MDSLNSVNHSKTLALKKFKHLLYKYYPKFVKTFKKHPNKFDCVPNMKNYWSIDRNVNVLQVGTGKNPTTPLYSDTKKK